MDYKHLRESLLKSLRDNYKVTAENCSFMIGLCHHGSGKILETKPDGRVVQEITEQDWQSIRNYYGWREAYRLLIGGTGIDHILYTVMARDTLLSMWVSYYTNRNNIGSSVEERIDMVKKLDR